MELKDNKSIIDELIENEKQFSMSSFYDAPDLNTESWINNELFFSIFTIEHYEILKDIYERLNKLSKMQSLLKKQYDRYDDNYSNYRYEIYFDLVRKRINCIENIENNDDYENIIKEISKKAVNQVKKIYSTATLTPYQPKYLMEKYKFLLNNLKSNDINLMVAYLEEQILELEKLSIFSIKFYR